MFIGFYFVKLNWVIVCIFILIKLVNDNKIVVNKIDGVLGIYVFLEVGNIKLREY